MTGPRAVRRSPLPRALLLTCVVACAAGCEDEPVAASGDDRLEIEIGGDGQPIGELLRRDAARRGTERPLRVRVPQHEPPEPEPRYRIVRLQEGETLSELCSRELGSAARWREIMELNGWSEADVSRLPAKQQVRLPIEQPLERSADSERR